jgi:TIR domain
VDWEDIEPSDEWWQSISEAINAADAVLFVLSPDSVASKVCRDEAAHAAAQQKRLIPVVCLNVEGLDLPEEVSAVNWVFLCDGDDWDAGMRNLERALELDSVIRPLAVIAAAVLPSAVRVERCAGRSCRGSRYGRGWRRRAVGRLDSLTGWENQLH